jgi:hypothetical protein
MKRVHGWEESEDSLSSDSPPGLTLKSDQTARKRKSAPPVASVPMKRQSSSQTKARAASISYSQQSHLREYAPSIFQDNQSRTNGYPPPFGHSQSYYTHGSQYPH